MQNLSEEKKPNPYNVDEFTRAYLECALWSSTDTVDGEDVNLDDNHDITDIAPDTLATLIAGCAKFQKNMAGLLKQAYRMDTGKPYTASNAGHDFWLTRNGHGAGFWDRGLREVGETLSNAARACGNIDLYIGDDGKIYA